MRRRTLLASVACGASLLAGCSGGISRNDTSKEIHNPTGHAEIRPLDTPFLRHGLTSESGQYLSAQLFLSGDSLHALDSTVASEYSETVDNLSKSQFALLTNLRCAATAPAYFWPETATWSKERVNIDLKRVGKNPVGGIDEAVGVALTAFEVDGEPPQGADITFPSGATMFVGTES